MLAGGVRAFQGRLRPVGFLAFETDEVVNSRRSCQETSGRIKRTRKPPPC
jgi:hypothetical protein